MQLPSSTSAFPDFLPVASGTAGPLALPSATPPGEAIAFGGTLDACLALGATVAVEAPTVAVGAEGSSLLGPQSPLPLGQGILASPSVMRGAARLAGLVLASPDHPPMAEVADSAGTLDPLAKGGEGEAEVPIFRGAFRGGRDVGPARPEVSLDPSMLCLTALIAPPPMEDVPVVEPAGLEAAEDVAGASGLERAGVLGATSGPGQTVAVGYAPVSLAQRPDAGLQGAGPSTSAEVQSPSVSLPADKPDGESSRLERDSGGLGSSPVSALGAARGVKPAAEGFDLGVDVGGRFPMAGFRSPARGTPDRLHDDRRGFSIGAEAMNPTDGSGAVGLPAPEGAPADSPPDAPGTGSSMRPVEGLEKTPASDGGGERLPAGVVQRGTPSSIGPHVSSEGLPPRRTRAVDTRSSVDRSEPSAARITLSGLTSVKEEFAPVSFDSKKTEITDKEPIADYMAIGGIADAKPMPPMFDFRSNASGSTVEAAPSGSRPPELARAEGAVATSAHQAVESVMAAVDRVTQHSRQAVTLDLSVAGEALQVRVELHANEVRATFRTDSSELRAVLEQEWQARPVDPGAARVVTPVFSPSSDQAWSGADGQGARRQRQSDVPAGQAAFSMPVRPRSSDPVAVPPSASVRPLSSRSHQLYSLA